MTDRTETESATPAAAVTGPNPLIKLAIDLGPLMVFFGTYFTVGIMAATATFMVATVVALTGGYLLERKIAPMPLVSGAVVMIFGGLTLYLNDALFIKLKPTIVNCLFASVLLTGLALRRNFLKIVMEHAFKLDEAGWRKLTLRWALFFLFLAALNEVMWRGFSEEIWVAYKVWGVFPLTIAFALAQMPLINKHQLTEEK